MNNSNKTRSNSKQESHVPEKTKQKKEQTKEGKKRATVIAIFEPNHHGRTDRPQQTNNRTVPHFTQQPDKSSNNNIITQLSPNNITVKSHTNGTESQHTDTSHDNNASITESQQTDTSHYNNASITESFMITQTSITPDNTNNVIDLTSCPPDNITKDANTIITDSQQISWQLEQDERH